MKDPDATERATDGHAQWNVGNAETSGSKEGLREDKFTKCRLCEQLLTEPRLLPCLHTFCLRCLENFDAQLTTTKKSPGARAKKFTCPCCRKEFALPVGGIGRLPVNVLFARLADRRHTLSSLDGVEHSSREVNSSLQLQVSFSF